MQAAQSLLIAAYVIMTNHMHVIWQSKNGKLSDTLRDYKSFCTKELIAAIKIEQESRRNWLLHMFAFHARTTNQNDEYKIWQSGSHPEEITSNQFLRSKINYIHENPVRAGIVEHEKDYRYSSASNYYGGKGFMEIDFLY